MAKTIGILGGMGPEATIAFYEKIIHLTPAKKDQDHIPAVIYSNTQIPDRTESILKNEHDAIIRELQNSANVLENASADFIAIPCNTSHFYIDKIRESVSIPVIDMIEETAKCARTMNVDKMALLATTGTVKTGIYQKHLEKLGIDVMIPNERVQQEVMRIIYDGIKAGKAGKAEYEKIISIIGDLRGMGAQVIILGCTELPLLFIGKKEEGTIDPMDILAEVSVKMAGK